jgi:SAM-dependent methyltransferase
VEHRYDYTQDSGLPEMRVRLAVLGSRIGQHLPVGRILEVGVGSGDATLMLTEAFASSGAELTCVDTDAENLAAAVRRLEARGLPVPRIHCARIEQAELPLAAFDHMVLFNVLEHLEDPIAVLRGLRPHLAPGGRLHISVPLAGSLHRWIGVEMGMIGDVRDLAESDLRFGHHRVYTLPDLLDHVRSAGLKVGEVHPFYFKPLPTATLSPLSWELHRALDALGTRFPEFASYVYLQAELPG